MACARPEGIGSHPKSMFLGATFQIQGNTLHLVSLAYPTAGLWPSGRYTSERLTRPYSGELPAGAVLSQRATIARSPRSCVAAPEHARDNRSCSLHPTFPPINSSTLWASKIPSSQASSCATSAASIRCIAQMRKRGLRKRGLSNLIELPRWPYSGSRRTRKANSVTGTKKPFVQSTSVRLRTAARRRFKTSDVSSPRRIRRHSAIVPDSRP